MSDGKYETIAATFHVFLDLQEKQIKMVQDLVHVLMDEDGNKHGKQVATDKEVVACLRCAGRERERKKRKARVESSWLD